MPVPPRAIRPRSREPPEPFADIAAGDLKGCRVAYSPDLGMLPVEAAVTEAIERALPLLTDLGCVVERAHPDLTGGAEAFDVIRALRFAGDHAELLRDHRAQLKDTVIWNIERGLALSVEQVLRANQLRAAQFLRMSAFLERFDVLVLPVSQVVPFPVEVDWVRSINGVPMATYIDWMQSCSLITMTSHPALSLPCGFTPMGCRWAFRSLAATAAKRNCWPSPPPGKRPSASPPAVPRWRMPPHQRSWPTALTSASARGARGA